MTDSALLALPALPNEKPQHYEAFSYWLQTGKSSTRTAEHFGVALGTVNVWKTKYDWEARGLEFEQRRAMAPYNKEQAANALMSSYAIEASEFVTTSAMEDYKAMVAIWRKSITRAAELLEAEGNSTFSGKSLKDYFAARDILDQMGRRIARLPAQYKQGGSYGVSSPTQISEASPSEDDALTWS